MRPPHEALPANRATARSTSRTRNGLCGDTRAGAQPARSSAASCAYAGSLAGSAVNACSSCAPPTRAHNTTLATSEAIAQYMRWSLAREPDERLASFAVNTIVHCSESKRRATVETNGMKKRPIAWRSGARYDDSTVGDYPTAVFFRDDALAAIPAPGFGSAASETTRARPRLARAVALRVSITSIASSTIC